MHTPTAKKLPSGQWFCRVRINGQDIGITRPTEREAVAEAMAIKAGIMSAGAKRPEKTLRQAIDEYIDERKNVLSPSTIAGYRVLQRNRMRRIMDKPLSKITEREIRRAVSDDAAEVSPKTVRNAYALLTSVLRDNGIKIEDGAIRMPQEEKTEKQIYSREDLRKLFLALRQSGRAQEIEIPVLLAAMLGLRRSEIVALRWEDVDIDARTIRVRGAVVLDEDGKEVRKGTKTTGSTRVLVNCPEYLMQRMSDADRISDRVCNLSLSALSHKFDRFLSAEGLPHIGLHNLRHTNASILLALNVPDKYAMQIGGWSSAQTMRNIYQHIMDDEMLRATELRNQFLRDILGAEKRRGKYRLVRYPEDMRGLKMAMKNVNKNKTP